MKGDDTTQQGVNGEEKKSSDSIQKGNPRRDDAMSDIVANARRARTEEEEPEKPEGGEPVEPESEAPSAPDDDEQGGEAHDEPAELPSDEPEGQEEESSDEPADEMVTIKVDGIEQEVPASKVQEAGVRALQKESAADRRLAEASQRMRDAEAKEREIQEITSRLSKQHEDSKGAAPSQADAQDYEAKARQVLQKIYDGEEDEAAAALAEVFAGIGRQEATQAPQFDANQLVSDTASRVQSEIERKNAIRQFRNDYSDLVEDPILERLVDEKAYEISQENPEWDDRTVLKEAGDQMRKWVSDKGGKKDGLQDKRERKRTTETPRVASQRLPSEPEQAPPSRSDVVANMRKSRGLPNA